MGVRNLVLVACFVLVASQFGNAADVAECWHCENAASNDDCQSNGYIETCDDGPTNGCQTELRVDSSGKQRITKRCKSLTVCTSEVVQFWGQCLGLTTGNSICYFCCQTDKCNWCLNVDGRCENDSGESGSSSSKSSKSKSSKSSKSKSKCKSKSKSSKGSKSSKSSKSSGSKSKSKSCKSSKSSKDCDSDEDDEGEQNEDDEGGLGDSQEDDYDSYDSCEYSDEGEDDEGGARGLYAGVVTLFATFAGYQFIR